MSDDFLSSLNFMVQRIQNEVKSVTKDNQMESRPIVYGGNIAMAAAANATKIKAVAASAPKSVAVGSSNVTKSSQSIPQPPKAAMQMPTKANTAAGLKSQPIQPVATPAAVASSASVQTLSHGKRVSAAALPQSATAAAIIKPLRPPPINDAYAAAQLPKQEKEPIPSVAMSKASVTPASSAPVAPRPSSAPSAQLSIPIPSSASKSSNVAENATISSSSHRPPIPLAHPPPPVASAVKASAVPASNPVARASPVVSTPTQSNAPPRGSPMQPSAASFPPSPFYSFLSSTPPIASNSSKQNHRHVPSNAAPPRASAPVPVAAPAPAPIPAVVSVPPVPYPYSSSTVSSAPAPSSLPPPPFTKPPRVSESRVIFDSITSKLNPDKYPDLGTLEYAQFDRWFGRFKRELRGKIKQQLEKKRFREEMKQREETLKALLGEESPSEESSDEYSGDEFCWMQPPAKRAKVTKFTAQMPANVPAPAASSAAASVPAPISQPAAAPALFTRDVFVQSLLAALKAGLLLYNKAKKNQKLEIGCWHSIPIEFGCVENQYREAIGAIGTVKPRLDREGKPLKHPSPIEDRFLSAAEVKSLFGRQRKGVTAVFYTDAGCMSKPRRIGVRPITLSSAELSYNKKTQLLKGTISIRKREYTFKEKSDSEDDRPPKVNAEAKEKREREEERDYYYDY